jgi:hypothetical protein
MMTESYIEEQVVPLTKERLITLTREVGKLFLSLEGTDQNPQSRYDHATAKIKEALTLLKERDRHPELHELFAKLDASCEIAETRRASFEERNPNLKLVTS